jgi:hypothetical protein
MRNLEMIRALANAKVDFTQKNKEGFTALDVADGKQQPAGRAGGRGGPPPGGGRGRGGRGASQQDVAKLLRELMGLPPAEPSTAPESKTPESTDGDSPDAGDVN